MPESHKSDTVCNSNDIVITTIPQPKNGSKTVDQIRWSYLKAIYTLCILMILAVLAATTVMFCITKSPLSFSLLSLLTPLLGLRRRVENFLFPISQEDLLLELTRQIKQDDGDHHLTWLHHLTRKLL